MKMARVFCAVVKGQGSIPRLTAAKFYMCPSVEYSLRIGQIDLLDKIG